MKTVLKRLNGGHHLVISRLCPALSNKNYAFEFPEISSGERYSIFEDFRKRGLHPNFQKFFLLEFSLPIKFYLHLFFHVSESKKFPDLCKLYQENFRTTCPRFDIFGGLDCMEIYLNCRYTNINIHLFVFPSSPCTRGQSKRWTVDVLNVLAWLLSV